jgi:cellulose synthase/poly-beta-1,6-N-acetylglucosamine synthase-like glycosyltransferase
MLLQKLVWYLTSSGALAMVGVLLVPLGINLALYQATHVWVLLRELWLRASGRLGREVSGEPLPTALITVPSLLRGRAELDSIRTAMESAAVNAYPGRLIVIACVDGTDEAPELCRELERWAAAARVPSSVQLRVSGSPARRGKGAAIDTGVEHVESALRSGAIDPAWQPVLFFNMDADSRLGPQALERLARAVLRKSVLTGEPGRIATSHVVVEPSCAWQGWRRFFTVEGWLALSVAREYLVAIGVGRHNVGFFTLLPRIGASGALYCTWYEVLRVAPRYARFITTLRLRDWLRWWLGAPPPSFARVEASLEPLPEGLAGMGDDTWITWLAMASTWRDGRLSFDFPRTPLHALWATIVAYFARTFRYDPRARIFTRTPTTMRGLYKQRMRWNVSRIWTSQRWGLALWYALPVGLYARLEVLLNVGFNTVLILGVLVLPFTRAPTMWIAVAFVIGAGYFVLRLAGTLIALLVAEHPRRALRLMLAVPTSGIYHLLFNVLPTVDGFVRQVLGHGLNTGFTPEATLVVGGQSRIALGYRVQRALRLALRSVISGDVPLGWFWLGWSKTRWTPNGYEGWDRRRPKPIPIRAPQEERGLDASVDEGRESLV